MRCELIDFECVARRAILRRRTQRPDLYPLEFGGRVCRREEGLNFRRRRGSWVANFASSPTLVEA
jgi:hypothetical protein